MNKKEIKKYLSLLRKSNHLIKNEKGKYQVVIYKRKKEIEIPNWAFKILEYLKVIIDISKDTLVKEIIKMHYFNNLNDLEIISKLPISETTYYKYKRKIEDIIYHLLISDGYITKKEIYEEVNIDGYNN